MMCKEHLDCVIVFFLLKKRAKHCAHYFVFIANICNNFINDTEFSFFVKTRGHCTLIINR